MNIVDTTLYTVIHFIQGDTYGRLCCSKEKSQITFRETQF